MINCKHCGSKKYVKFGTTNNGKQRYKCKDCGKSFRQGDEREKHSVEKKHRAIGYYLRGTGIRAIAENEGVSPSIVLHWIRHSGRILQEKLLSAKISDNAKDIAILEVDELFSYVKKKSTKSMFGLLLIETEIKLLMLK